MRLIELDPEWLKATDEHTYEICDTLEQAQGLCFLCPVCFTRSGIHGCHRILCWFNGRGVSADRSPGPGRWNPQGTSFHDLSFIGPGACSVLLHGPGCGAHFHIEKGEIK
jgi:hypothetical protein